MPRPSVFVVSALLSGPALTWQPAPVPRAAGWQPLRTFADDRRIPQAVRAEVRRQFETILDVLASTPAGRSPGVEIRPELRIARRDSGPYAATLTLNVYPPVPNTVDDRGRPRRSLQNAIELRANALDVLCWQECPDWFPEPAMRRAGGVGVYEKVAGDGRDVILLSARGALPWAAVTREEIVRARARYFREPLEKAEADIRQRRGGAPVLETWLRERPERRKEHEALVLTLRSAGQPADAIAEIRERFEATERDTEKMLRDMRKDEAATRALENASLDDARELVASVEDRLAAMTPAERQSPAYGGCDEPEQMTDLCPADAPGARRFVKLNPAFFDPRLPRMALQVIGVECATAPAGDSPVAQFVRALFEATDWKAVQELLR